MKTTLLIWEEGYVFLYVVSREEAGEDGKKLNFCENPFFYNWSKKEDQTQTLKRLCVNISSHTCSAYLDMKNDTSWGRSS